MPILSWFCIGVILDKDLINVFSITYPLQFLYSVLLHIFGTGANISKEKDNNKNIVPSSLILGSIISILSYGLIALNVDKYLNFMGYNIETYKIFTVYSILQLGISVIFYLLMEQLYFEDKENLASKYCIIFNLLNFITLMTCSIITRNQFISAILTLIILFIYVLIIFIKLFKKTKFTINILNNLKYESCTICSDILFLLIFLFGLKNANSFGIEYIAAINFVALITDTQWDALSAVTTVAKIDIAKNRFNYKEHIKNAYKLTGILLFSSILMILCLYRFYNLNLMLVIRYFSFEFFGFLIWAKYAIDNVLIQLNYSAVKSTSVKFISNFIRFAISLSPTPFCTAIGQVTSAIIQFISYGYIKKRHCN